jgi:hypothetical protein
MKSLKQIRTEIEAAQAEYRKRANLDIGVIRGAVDTREIADRINALIAQYNARSRRDHYERGILVGGAE